MSEAAKSIIHRWVEECWNRRDPAAADRFISPNFIDHDGRPGETPGIEGVKETFGAFFSAFPDLHCTVERMVAEDDYVAWRWTGHGTHQGNFMGVPPTGKKIHMMGTVISRVVDGKLVEHWGKPDMLSWLQQMGVISAPGQVGG